MHVLMIDDNIAEHILLQDDLDEFIHLSTVLNKDQVIEILERKKFDLITIDINLITENGYEVAEELKEYGIDILINSTGINTHYPMHISDKIETISKEELANYINKKALTHGISN